MIKGENQCSPFIFLKVNAALSENASLRCLFFQSGSRFIGMDLLWERTPLSMNSFEFVNTIRLKTALFLRRSMT